MTDDRTLTIMVRKLDGKADADRTRANLVKFFLSWVVNELKQHMDAAAQLNIGLPEVEAFLEALVSGGQHPALQEWEEHKGGHPAPASHELRARRLIILLAVALERAGWQKGAAHRFAAREATRAHVFASATTHKAIEHWQERQPELTPADEQMLATAIASCGLDQPIGWRSTSLG